MASCSRDVDITPAEENEKFFIPAGFPVPNYDLSSTYSEKKFQLGKKLFFDPILSVDNTISCASCHLPEAAFSDPGNSFSVGINGSTATRNSPALINLAWNPSFMWDGGVNHIEVQPLAPLTNPLEMGTDLTPIIAKLNQGVSYRNDFLKTFESDSITSAQLFMALAHYMSCLISSESKFDNYLKGESTLSNAELNGLNLFSQNCASCHSIPLFTNHTYANNGIGINTVTDDAGRYIITLQDEDSLKFKIPTLRNVEVTFPYMHDGRFATLEAVLNHYASQNFPAGTDTNIINIQLNSSEKNDIILFLKTLTDQKFLHNDSYLP